jgi:hypothetical protein
MIFTDMPHVMKNPSRLEWFVDTARNRTSLVNSEWLGSILYILAGIWAITFLEEQTCYSVSYDLQMNTTRRRQYEEQMSHLIGQGANLHYLDEDGCTIVEIWVNSFHPVDAQAIIKDWLTFLEGCGVDGAKYGRGERMMFQQHSVLSDWEDCRKRAVTFSEDDGGTFVISVSWENDLPGPAMEVLREFSGVGDDAMFSPLLSFTQPDWQVLWPFSDAAIFCQICLNRGLGFCTTGSCRKKRDRFQRRHTKKAKANKLGHEVTRQDLKLVGAWVD